MVLRHVTEFVWDIAHLKSSPDAIIAPTDWIALSLAAVLYIGFLRSKRLNEFMNEVAQELSKVTWPPRKETVVSAGVIAVLVGIVSLILVGFDTLWQKLVGLILF